MLYKLPARKTARHPGSATPDPVDVVIAEALRFLIESASAEQRKSPMIQHAMVLWMRIALALPVKPAASSSQSRGAR